LGKGFNRGELGAVMSADGDTIGRVSWRIDLQRRQRRPELTADDPMLRPPEIEQPDSMLARDQLEGIVRSQIAKLPADQLLLLQAAFYDGLSHSEIARAFNLPLGTVKSRIRLAFLRLRGELEGAT
jgi:RNA polymerase sigma-70 factor (ECF subfamily)